MEPQEHKMTCKICGKEFFLKTESKTMDTCDSCISEKIKQLEKELTTIPVENIREKISEYIKFRDYLNELEFLLNNFYQPTFEM
ncbi:hypothetical protein KKH38_04740 [Patescibacteria group bacterium]|nr:hypothetical protein [Patescibacteria group bacterium]MBU4600715.1 hypothetical protein [Patescibacteria group bacterium]MCG2698161.1 hypothetical protein [Candidatus Parcubacteria bacterium]